jgi:hypothetical protein
MAASQPPNQAVPEDSADESSSAYYYYSDGGVTDDHDHGCLSLVSQDDLGHRSTFSHSPSEDETAITGPPTPYRLLSSRAPSSERSGSNNFFPEVPASGSSLGPPETLPRALELEPELCVSRPPNASIEAQLLVLTVMYAQTSRTKVPPCTLSTGMQ